jgi:hypothetical protein
MGVMMSLYGWEIEKGSGRIVAELAVNRTMSAGAIERPECGRRSDYLGRQSAQ